MAIEADKWSEQINKAIDHGVVASQEYNLAGLFNV